MRMVLEINYQKILLSEEADPTSIFNALNGACEVREVGSYYEGGRTYVIEKSQKGILLSIVDSGRIFNSEEEYKAFKQKMTQEGVE